MATKKVERNVIDYHMWIKAVIVKGNKYWFAWKFLVYSASFQIQINSEDHILITVIMM